MGASASQILGAPEQEPQNVVTAASPSITNSPPYQPTIGVLTVPLSHSACTSEADGPCDTKSFVHCYIVKWLEQVGLQPVPIRFDSSKEELDVMFDCVNGLLFPGGGYPIVDMHSKFDDSARHLLNRAAKANDSGDYFPVWAICMGFELMCVLTAGDPTVLHRGAYDASVYAVPLQLTAAANQSRFLGPDSGGLAERLGSKPVCVNVHANGVPPDVFQSNSRLSSNFRMLSTNVDPLGRPFVSTIEAINYPFYGTQWHPEKPQYDWGLVGGGDNVHSLEAMQLMQHVALFFASEARKNNHRFPSRQALASSVIYNYRIQGDTPSQFYLFGPTTTSTGYY